MGANRVLVVVWALVRWAAALYVVVGIPLMLIDAYGRWVAYGSWVLILIATGVSDWVKDLGRRLTGRSRAGG
ncbi:hypothetical protein [Umezawaea sp. NPDC059074]|uniref:hypothetical protein n=1 Tax=Umezawaea sp. NPDC059074 TaxID=3346716 RepID=UPI0036A1A1CF